MAKLRVSDTFVGMNRQQRRKNFKEVSKDIVGFIREMVADMRESEEGLSLEDITGEEFMALESEDKGWIDLFVPIDKRLRYECCRDRFLQYSEALEVAVQAGKGHELHSNGLICYNDFAFKRFLDAIHEAERVRRSTARDKKAATFN